MNFIKEEIFNAVFPDDAACYNFYLSFKIFYETIECPKYTKHEKG
jgi:hypothetical protein